jgi:hypothetical protein
MEIFSKACCVLLLSAIFITNNLFAQDEMSAIHKNNVSKDATSSSLSNFFYANAGDLKLGGVSIGYQRFLTSGLAAFGAVGLNSIEIFEMYQDERPQIYINNTSDFIILGTKPGVITNFGLKYFYSKKMNGIFLAADVNNINMKYYYELTSNQYINAKVGNQFVMNYNIRQLRMFYGYSSSINNSDLYFDVSFGTGLKFLTNDSFRFDSNYYTINNYSQTYRDINIDKEKKIDVGFFLNIKVGYLF